MTSPRRARHFRPERSEGALQDHLAAVVSSQISELSLPNAPATNVKVPVHAKREWSAGSRDGRRRMRRGP